jgi:hypothetical protein
MPSTSSHMEIFRINGRDRRREMAGTQEKNRDAQRR